MPTSPWASPWPGEWMDVNDVAHGTMIVIGSFVTFFLFKSIGLDPFLSIPFSMFILFLIGYCTQKFLS